MKQIFLDSLKVYVQNPDKLPTFLDGVYFDKAFIPKEFCDIVYPILTKKGFIKARAVELNGGIYDEWVLER